MALLSANGRHRVRRSVARVVKARHRAGDTLPALADLLGVSVATVKRWIDGDGYPTFTKASDVAPRLGLDPESGKPVRP